MVSPDIGNVKYPHGRTDQQQQKSNRQRLRYISQNDRLPLLSLFACFHWKLREVFIPYVWFLISASLKVWTRQNRIRTFLKTPLVFSGFSLLSWALLSCGFRGSSGCGPPSISRLYEMRGSTSCSPFRCQAAPHRVSLFVDFLSMSTFSFRPLQQGKTHYQLPGMAIADSADNEFRETSPEMNLKNFLWNGVKTNKQTKNTLRSHTKQINNASWIRRLMSHL